MSTLFGIYMLVGIFYCLVNGAVRKLDNDDYLLSFIWITLWPLCIIALIIDNISKLFKK